MLLFSMCEVLPRIDLHKKQEFIVIEHKNLSAATFT